MAKKFPPSPGPSPFTPKQQLIRAPSYPPMWDETGDLPLPDVLAPLHRSSEPDAPEPLSLENAQDMLRKKAMELLSASPGRVNQLNIEIQKLRIICMVLREVELGVSDPNTYKELNLMNKMLTGKDMEGEAERQQTEEEEAAAVKALESRGIKAESAGRIMRALTAIMTSKATPVVETLDEDEPPEPA